MKRLILNLVTMLVTFALSIGIHRLISERQVHDFPPPKVEAVSLAPFETSRELVETVEPVPPVPDATPTPILVLDYDREKFSPWGYFFIMGRKPKEFADIDGLEVALHPGENSDGSISVHTCSSGVDRDWALANFALVTQQRLFFATSQMRNSEVEYRFDGKFIRTDFDAVVGKNIAVLRGTLTKTKNGRKIAEHTFSFRMEHLGC